MSNDLSGNLKGLAPSEIKAIKKLAQRGCGRDEWVSIELAREICTLATELRRRIGLLINRQGRIESVVVGTKEILYLPDLGRYRLGPGRLRNLRLVFTDLSGSGEKPVIPFDIYADLEKLRLDAVISVRSGKNKIEMSYAHLVPSHGGSEAAVSTDHVSDIGMFDVDFGEFIRDLDSELASDVSTLVGPGDVGAVLVGVYDSAGQDPKSSMAELKELARTAGVVIVDQVIQKRKVDPKTFLGSGKLQEVVLLCLRRGAELLIFDAELKPGQWRAITNATELKIIDRSMLILDIFAQRAQSSDGRLQVELAQLTYNLPRLVEKDAGLSRLSGGIGGRGPGETKLEIGRRRIRDRISELQKRIEKVRGSRELRRTKRRENDLKLVAIVGYTNVGKSTLFNTLTGSGVIAENKLFATLDPSQRRLYLPGRPPQSTPGEKMAILSDTVGFIRQLPKELETAFRATLEELYDATLLLHVVDASDPDCMQKYQAVRKTLDTMELAGTPELVLVNKIDAVTPEQAEIVVNELNGLAISATKGIGLSELKARLSAVV